MLSARRTKVCAGAVNQRFPLAARRDGGTRTVSAQNKVVEN